MSIKTFKKLSNKYPSFHLSTNIVCCPGCFTAGFPSGVVVSLSVYKLNVTCSKPPRAVYSHCKLCRARASGFKSF